MTRGNECYLFSKANYNVKVRYKNDTLILPPFASNVKISDDSQLGPLPKEVTKKVILKKKQMETKGVFSNVTVEKVRVGNSSKTSKVSSKKRNKKKEDK